MLGCIVTNWPHIFISQKESDMTTAPTVTPLTGYAANVQLFATRYRQGGRTVYSMDLSLEQIDALITPPDPLVASPGNRMIRQAHADAFAKYLRQRTDWVAPSLLLRTPKSFDFEVREEIAGVQFGIVTIPRRSLADLHIVDGQHRILGVIRAYKMIADDLDKARSNLATVRKVEPGGTAEKDARARITDLDKQLSRLSGEFVSVQIHVESDPVKYKQMFFDIADNALGITASVKVRFDSQKVVNRARATVMDYHPLLLGRIDPEGDRLKKMSQFWMGAKHVSEIVRTVNVGLDGRVSRRQEEAAEDKLFADKGMAFFTALTDSFPQLMAMQLGQLLPDQLRSTSLLGSMLFIRVLGGVYYDLSTDRGWSDELVVEFFAKLAPHVSAPTYEGDIWLEHLPYLFTPNTMAPHSRRQDLSALREALTGWAIDKPSWLNKKPRPRPEPEDEIDPEYGAGYAVIGADIPVE